MLRNDHWSPLGDASETGKMTTNVKKEREI